MSKGPTLYQLLNRTPQGRIIAATLKKKHAKNPQLLGAFLPGLKKVGRVTSKITGGIAKVAAGMVGIPPSAINALAKVDPMTKKKLDAALIATKAGQQAAAMVDAAKNGPGPAKENIFSKIKPVYIAAGAVGIAAVIIVVTKKKK